MSVSITRIATMAAIAAFATTGLMQGAQQAAFHLPVTAHWGMAVLQPGDYKIILPEPSIGHASLLVEGDRKTVYELPLLTIATGLSDSSYLKLREVNGAYFVRELSSGKTGKTFTFSTPKLNRRGEVVAQAGDRNIPVSGN